MAKYLLFDLDGTLTDPAIGITNAVMVALAHWNIHPATREELYPFIGPPLLDSFMKFYGFTEDQAHEAIRHYRGHYATIGLYENKVYDGVAEMLRNLKEAGKVILLATSKPEAFAEKILEKFGLSVYFDGIYGSLLNETRVHKDEVIEYALEQHGNPAPEDCLMIGDREHDVFGSAKHGLSCVGVLYGYGDAEELTKAGAVHLCETVKDLEEYLLNA
ncbi:MAG: HAD family hydrolase [Clostridia bacterium]|nr:HAD family hydrolase [Clostridia bacterium]